MGTLLVWWPTPVKKLGELAGHAAGAVLIVVVLLFLLLLSLSLLLLLLLYFLIFICANRNGSVSSGMYMSLTMWVLVHLCTKES